MISNLPMSWPAPGWPLLGGAMDSMITSTWQPPQVPLHILSFSLAELTPFEHNPDLISYFCRVIVIPSLLIYLLSATHLLPIESGIAAPSGSLELV